MYFYKNISLSFLPVNKVFLIKVFFKFINWFENKFANIPPKLKKINPRLARYKGALSSLVNHKADQSMIIPFEPNIIKSRNPKTKTFFSGIFNTNKYRYIHSLYFIF